MLPDIEKLLVLQNRDRRIRTLKLELKNIPEERAGVERRLATANAGAEQVKLKVKELEVQKNRLAVQAQGKRDQINRFKTQQTQTRKNEEYQAFTHEIAHFGTEIQKIEDDELNVMEELEQMKPVMAEAEERAKEARARVVTQIADLDAKAKSIKDNLVNLEAERKTLAVGIDEDLLEQYNRLFVSKNGDAIVPLEHEVCMGCHMKLTTQTFVRVKGAKEVAHCEQCGRILYYRL